MAVDAAKAAVPIMTKAMEEQNITPAQNVLGMSQQLSQPEAEQKDCA